jgi:PERQ amino acid-rich with GYF domain-containing protein
LFYQFKLADHRYGREEMLALYSPDLSIPSSFKSLGPVVKDTAIQPMSFLPLSEEEQRSQVHGVNSNVVLKLVGRGPARGTRGGAPAGPFKSGRPGRLREGSYHRETSVDESEDQTDGFERKFYDNERPSNFRTKGDNSRSGRALNWRTAQSEDGGGGEGWRAAPMSPGPKSPDKWHVVGPRYSWKDHNDSRERPQQQSGRRGSEREKASNDRESGGFQHRIGGRWDRLSESEDIRDELRSQQKEETDIDKSHWEMKDDEANKRKENRDISPQANEMESSRGRKEESSQINEGKEKAKEPIETTVAVTKRETKVQRTLLNDGMNHGHVTQMEEENQLDPKMPVKSGTDYESDTVTGMMTAPPRPEQMARLYAAGRGRGRANTVPPRPQLPKVGNVDDIVNSQQTDNKVNARSFPASIKPGRVVDRQDEDKIIEGLEQSARHLVAGVVEDDEQDLSFPSQHTSISDYKRLPIQTTAMQLQQPQTFEVVKPSVSAVGLSHEPVMSSFNVHTMAEPHMAAVPDGQSVLSLHHPASADIMNQWLYTDPQGDIQGPFTSEEMFDWMRTGYFRMELLVKRACDEEFRPLGEMIKLWGRVPFTRGTAPPPLVKPGSSQWKPIEPLNLAQQQMLLQLQQQQQSQPQHLMKEPGPVNQQLISPGGENATSSIWSGPSGDIWGLSGSLAGTGQSLWDSSTKKPELTVEDKGLHSTLQKSEETHQRQNELAKEKTLREAEEREKMIKEQERLQREEEQKRKREEEQKRKHEEILRQQEETRKQEEKRQKQEEERRKREKQQQIHEMEQKRQEAERQKKRQEEEIKKLQEEAHRQQQLALQKQQEAARQKQEAAAAAAAAVHQRQAHQNEVLAHMQLQQAEAQRKQQMQHKSQVPGWKAVQPSVSLVEIQQQEAEQEVNMIRCLETAVLMICLIDRDAYTYNKSIIRCRFSHMQAGVAKLKDLVLFPLLRSNRSSKFKNTQSLLNKGIQSVICHSVLPVGNLTYILVNRCRVE